MLSDASMRWANFADSFWYLDAMGSKARHGYDVFCRQDFVGIDYGLLNPRTNDPLPDYFAGLVWGQTMGAGVVQATSNDTDHVRAYAHCTPSPPATSASVPRRSKGNAATTSGAGSLTLLLMNLKNTTVAASDAGSGSNTKANVVDNDDDDDNNTMHITIDGVVGCTPSSCPHSRFTLSGPQGTNSTQVALNGQLLELDAQTGRLPSMPFAPERVNATSNVVAVAPATIVFLVFDGAGTAVGC